MRVNRLLFSFFQSYSALLLFFLAGHILQATPHDYPNQNFSVDIPFDWRKMDSMPPTILGAFQNTNKSKGFIFSGGRIPAKERATAMRDVKAATLDGARVNNLTISKTYETNLSGIAFHVTFLDSSNSTIVTYAGLDVDMLYNFQILKSNGHADGDEELAGIMQSFKTLKTRPDASLSVGTKSEKIDGPFPWKYLFTAIIVAGVCILIWAKRTKRESVEVVDLQNPTAGQKPFQKSFACALAFYLLILLVLIFSGSASAYRIGYSFSTCFFPAVPTALWASVSKSKWSWAKYTTIYVGFLVLVAVMMNSNKAH